MATMTIRNLDETTQANLRLLAASHGCSMEEEARHILSRAVNAPMPAEGLGSRLHRRFAALGGVELERHELSDRPLPEFGGVSET